MIARNSGLRLLITSFASSKPRAAINASSSYSFAAGHDIQAQRKFLPSSIIDPENRVEPVTEQAQTFDLERVRPQCLERHGT
jgi:hypothetical protein